MERMGCWSRTWMLTMGIAQVPRHSRPRLRHSRKHPVIPADAGIQSKAKHADHTRGFELGCEGWVRMERITAAPMDSRVRGNDVWPSLDSGFRRNDVSTDQHQRNNPLPQQPILKILTHPSHPSSKARMGFGVLCLTLDSRVRGNDGGLRE